MFGTQFSNLAMSLVLWAIKGLFVCALCLVLGTIVTCGSILVHIGDDNGSFMIMGVVVFGFLVSLLRW